jgi:hypothetical protein
VILIFYADIYNALVIEKINNSSTQHILFETKKLNDRERNFISMMKNLQLKTRPLVFVVK